MATADESTVERPSHAKLADSLPRLLSDLREADFEVGTEQYVAACDVLVRFTGTSHLLSSLELRATFAGIFCTNPTEQNRFPEIFDPWYRSLQVVSKAEAPPPQGPAQPPTWLGLSRVDRFRAWAVSAVLCFLVLGVLVWRFLSPVEEVPIQVEKPQAETRQPPPTPRTTSSFPRTPSEPIIPPPTYRPLWAKFGQEAWVGVCSLWGLWVVARLALRQTVLTRRRQRPGEQIRLESLRLAGAQGSLFSTSALSDTWRHLRKFRTLPSSQLNERATIDRTLDAGGYFRPVYRERQVPPAYLLLIDRRHGEDHAAAMATELEAALRREQIVCTTFDYHEDPRYCRLPGESAAARGPATLAGVYGDRTLLLAGDGDSLFDAETGRPKPWMQEFGRFEQKHLLTTDPAWCQHDRMDDLMQIGLHVLPLTTEGLAQFRRGVQTMGEDDPRDVPLPQRFAVSPASWLEEHALARSTERAVLLELKEYLGAEGFLLLSATAAYPGIYWQLTRTLDTQLGLAGVDRGLRLRKLARLPWYRYGRMPDGIRVAILRSLDRMNRRRISDAYHALLEHRTQDPLQLPVAVPDWTKARAALREMVQVSERHEPLGDRVFADVIRGRKPRMLEFEWPYLTPPLFARSHWSSLVGPLLAGVVLIPMAIWLNVWVWQSWIEPLAHEQSVRAMQAQHQQVRVRLASPTNLVPLSKALQQSLRNWGFTVDPAAASDTRPESFLQEQLRVQRIQKGNKPENGTDDVTRISFKSGQKDKARLVAARVAYLAYGAEPVLMEEESLNRGDVEISIQLGGTLRGFRDPVQETREPAGTEQPITKDPQTGTRRGLRTARHYLLRNNTEGPGFGLYSYLLLSAKSQYEEETKRHLKILEVSLRVMSSAEEHLSWHRRPSELHVTHIPVTELPNGKVDDPDFAKKVLAVYDFARAQALLDKLEKTYNQGPYLISVRTPLTSKTTPHQAYFIQDFTGVAPELVMRAVEFFIFSTAQERTWTEQSMRSLSFKMRNLIELTRRKLILPSEQSGE